jgi:hypothetical protein
MLRDAVTEHTLAFTLEPGITALAVIDMQYASACRTAGFGRWLEQNGRSPEGAYRFDRIEGLLVPNIGTSRSSGSTISCDCSSVSAQMVGGRDLIPHVRSSSVTSGTLTAIASSSFSTNSRRVRASRYSRSCR